MKHRLDTLSSELLMKINSKARKTLLRSSRVPKRLRNCTQILLILSSVKLHAFKKFKDTSDAVKSLSEFIEGNMPKDLKTFLKKNIISKDIQENLLCNN